MILLQLVNTMEAHPDFADLSKHIKQQIERAAMMASYDEGDVKRFEGLKKYMNNIGPDDFLTIPMDKIVLLTQIRIPSLHQEFWRSEGILGKILPILGETFLVDFCIIAIETKALNNM
ncbi:MAG: hypothetical protein ABH879_07440 [archaeon]